MGGGQGGGACCHGYQRSASAATPGAAFYRSFCLFVCLQWLHGYFLLLAGMQVIIMQIIICTM